MNQTLMQLHPGDFILIKSSHLTGYRCKYDTKSIVAIKPYSFLLVLEIKKRYSNLEDMFNILCLYNGQKINLEIDIFDFDKQASVISFPAELKNKDPHIDDIDIWLNNHMDVQGKCFYFRDNCIVINKAKYPNKNKHTVNCSYLTSKEPFIGLGIKRNSLRRSLIFEFLYKNEICWKEFKNSNLSKHYKDNFERIFKRL